MQDNWHYSGKGISLARLKFPFPSPPALVFFFPVVVIGGSGSFGALFNQFHKQGVSPAPLSLRGVVYRHKGGLSC